MDHPFRDGCEATDLTISTKRAPRGERLASVSLDVRPFSISVRMNGLTISSSVRQNWPIISRRSDHHCRPLHLAQVETERERSLVFIDGAFAHSFTKPLFSTNAMGSTVVLPHVPSTAELALAIVALAALPVRPLYARVDLIPGDDGPVLMELELIEPDLSLRLHQAAAD